MLFANQYQSVAQTHRYSEQFFNGAGSGAQCVIWDTWRAGLTPGVYLKMTIYGTNDVVGQTCTDITVTNAMATAIKNATATSTCAYVSPPTNGHVWSVCNRYNAEVWLDPPACCSGSNCPSPNAYILRPCIGGTNSNWGGVNTATCGAPTQIMAIEFWYGFPCTDTPKTELTGPSQVCPNRPYTVKPVKFFASATYNWQYSFNGTSWSNFTGSVDPNSGGIVDSTIAPKWYRCKISCNLNSFYYTTPTILVNIAPFYYCYCIQGATGTPDRLDVGNVKVIGMSKGDTLLNYGNPLPLISNASANKRYSGLQDSAAPVVLYKDSTYRLFVSQINSAASPTAGRVKVYIDYDRDGLFDQGTELIMNKAITNPLGWDSIQFKVPSVVEIGLTGLRVVVRNDTLSDPCTSFTEGETEDYLAELRYEPCKGMPNVGKTEGDTAVCFGYDYVVTDTTYERLKSEIRRAWQVSADNLLWFNVPNSTGKDTLARVFTGQPLYYRMQVVCGATKDTGYSQAMLVNQKTAVKCYCYSQAVGGKFLDTSDIGGFSLAGYVNNDGGTHLDNPKATRKRTDYTDETPIVINVDSLYNISTFHTMRRAEHADAKITIFMDFNNDHDYDIPDERVFTGYTSVGNFTLIDQLVVPKLAIMNVATGMRVILNNDIAPNKPSDDACGAYTSGETEDYMVIFQKAFPTTVNDNGRITNVGLYPNPTTGKFILQFSSTDAVKEVKVTITNVTGQKMIEEVCPHKGGQFTKELDLSGRAKGVYFVELQSNGEKVVRKLVVQ